MLTPCIAVYVYIHHCICIALRTSLYTSHSMYITTATHPLLPPNAQRLQAALPPGDVVSSCRLDAATGSLLKITTPGWGYFATNEAPLGDPSAPGTALPQQGSGPQAHMDACAEVARVVQERVAAAPSSLTQDQAELAQMMAGPMAHTLARHCVQYRAEWKEVAGAVLDVLLEVQRTCAEDMNRTG